MRDINRIDPFLNTLKQLWLKYPDFRFIQLITIITKREDWLYKEDCVVQDVVKKMIEGEIKKA